MFGIDIIDATLIPALSLSFLAGIISFLSPCVLPIVPPYLAYMSGISISDATGNDKPVSLFLPALFFVLGLSTVFLILGFAASALGKLFLSYQDALNTIAGFLVMGFGLHFLGIVRIELLEREARFEASSRNGSAFGAYVLGLAFAFGWTPCIGPQLASILTMAASEASLVRGTALLGIYAVGLGVPFLLVAFGACCLIHLGQPDNWKCKSDEECMTCAPLHSRPRSARSTRVWTRSALHPQ